MAKAQGESLKVRFNVFLEELNRKRVNKAMGRTAEKRIILDIDSSESPVHGDIQTTAKYLPCEDKDVAQAGQELSRRLIRKAHSLDK